MLTEVPRTERSAETKRRPIALLVLLTYTWSRWELLVVAALLVWRAYRRSGAPAARVQVSRSVSTSPRRSR